MRALKASFSNHVSHVLDIPRVGVRLHVEGSVLVERFKGMLRRIHRGTTLLRDSACSRSEGIDLVLRTGDSSSSPVVERFLKRHSCDRIIEFDPFPIIAKRLAISHFFRIAPGRTMERCKFSHRLLAVAARRHPVGVEPAP